MYFLLPQGSVSLGGEMNAWALIYFATRAIDRTKRNYILAGDTVKFRYTSVGTYINDMPVHFQFQLWRGVKLPGEGNTVIQWELL